MNAWDFIQILLRAQFPSSLNVEVEISILDGAVIKSTEGDTFIVGEVKDVIIENNKVKILGWQKNDRIS